MRDLFADPAGTADALAALARKPLNFDLAGGSPSAGDGWRIDDYRQALPREPAGPPLAAGPWEAACRVLREYEFVDPAIVRAAFRADAPLAGRDMLLELRVLGLRFHVGVRVGEVIAGTVAAGGREAERWGWCYRTLEGHFEAGQMDYEVRKWLDTGEVEFRIHAFSRTARIDNPLLRLGFRLLGRRKQARFGRTACERMRRLTEDELRATRPTPRTAPGGLALRPTR